MTKESVPGYTLILSFGGPVFSVAYHGTFRKGVGGPVSVLGPKLVNLLRTSPLLSHNIFFGLTYFLSDDDSYQGFLSSIKTKTIEELVHKLLDRETGEISPLAFREEGI